MTTRKPLVVLGAFDPEMRAIEELVLTHGHFVIEARSKGKRVTSRTAYEADIPDCEDEQIWVECRPRNGFGERKVLIVDHHLPGDPGYGGPAHMYWQASSLGQICAILGQEPTNRLRMIAAADHCLSAAYRGECPGINPKRLCEWRVSSRAAFQRRSTTDVMADIQSTIRLLKQAPRLELGGESVADLRICQRAISEVAEATAMTGIPCLVLGHHKGKVRLVGSRGPAVRRFLRNQVPGIELTGLYGDPARGFAGGYKHEKPYAE